MNVRASALAFAVTLNALPWLTLPVASLAQTQAQAEPEAQGPERATPRLVAGDDRLSLVIPLTDVEGADVEDTGDGVLVTLPVPLEGQPLAEALRAAPDWIADLRYGYDALFVVPMPGVRVNPARDADGLRLDFERIEAVVTPVDVVDEDDGSGLRLARLDSVVRHRAGNSLGARVGLRHLTEDDPADTQSLIDLAQVERQLGRVEQAIALYGRALELAPGTAGLIRERASALRERAPRVTVDQRFTTVLDAEDQISTTLGTELPLQGNLRIGLRMERRAVDSPGVLDPLTGTTVAFDGARARLFAHADVLGLGPGHTRLRAHASGRVAGAGVDYAVPGNRGTTAVGFTWHEPRWEFVEGIAHGGWRDRIEVRHEARQRRRLSFNVSLAGNRYGLDDTGELARSWEFEFLARAMVRASEPFVSVGYALSTERFGTISQRTDTFGNPFSPIGFSESEVHRLDLFVAERLTDYVQISASGGYSVDRLQERGPFAGASLTWTPLPGVETVFDVNHSESSSSGSGGATTTASIRLDVRF